MLYEEQTLGRTSHSSAVFHGHAVVCFLRTGAQRATRKISRYSELDNSDTISFAATGGTAEDR